MKRNSRTFRNSTFNRNHGIGVYLAALLILCAVAFLGCSDDGDTKNTYVDPPETLGYLNVNVNPESTDVVVTGPDGFSQTFTGNQLLTELEPGQYATSGTADGFVDQNSETNVVAGQTSTIYLALQPTTKNYEVPSEEFGYLNVNVIPPTTEVVVTGPYGQLEPSFTGNKLLTKLEPGQYITSGTASGFVDQICETNVVAGQTSTTYLVLQPTTAITDAPRSVYRNEQGNLIPLDIDDINSGQLVFYAWLEDEASGIITTNLTSGDITDPTRPLVDEQREVATSFTQNLACAWVGFKDATGVTQPVIGADVRWEIDQFWADRLNSMQFGTSDDNRSAVNYGVFDDQADTRTNNGRLETERFPFAVTEFPLYNMTGVGTPFIDGLTWVTLFSPDAKADGRIVAVATVNGEEIGKQILYKSFAPTPKLEITKTVDKDVVNLVNGSATVNWTVTVAMLTHE